MAFKTQIIAHRGESFDAPENTLASINLAWERGAEAVEVDVHLSKDNHVVVIHDYNTKRVGNRNKKVSKQTLSELKELEIGSWKNKKWKDEKIPTLKEVLATVPSDRKIIIEIKSDEEVLPFLKKGVQESGLKNIRVEFISFNYSTIVAAKKTFPKNNCLYLVDLDYTWYTRLISPSVEKIIAKTKEGNLDGINVWAGKLLTKQFAEKVKAADLLLYTWTVNNPQQTRQLIQWQVDGITTDKAQWLKNEIATM
ncbi:MAG: glycerophosphodiester phosphodiesterase [Melioribacteraceae bacterium]